METTVSSDSIRIINSLEDGFLRADSQGKIIVANRVIAQMCGYESAEKMLGLHMKTLYARPEERDKILKDLKEGNKLANFELELKRKDGNTFWSLNTINFYYDEKGNPKGTEGLIRDHTVYRQTKMRLEHNNNVLSALRDISHLIVKEQDVSELLGNICGILSHKKGYNNVWIMLLDENIKFKSVYQAGISTEFQEIKNLLAKNQFTTCILEVLKKNTVISVPNTEDVCNYCPLAKQYQNSGAITAPIVHQNKLYGVITVSVPQAYFFQEETELVKLISDDIGYALYSIQTNHLRVKAEKEIITANLELKAANQQLAANEQQLKAANQQLAANEQQLRAANQQLAANEQQLKAANQQLRAHELELIKSKNTAERYLNVAAEIIISLDNKGDITLLNDSGHQLLGYTSGELIGRNWFTACLSQENMNEVKSVFEQIMKGQLEHVAKYESDIRTKSGEIKTILWHNTILKDEQGKISGTLSSGEDISIWKKAEDERRKSDERFRIAQEMSPDGFTILHPIRNDQNRVIDFTWVYENKAVAKLNGTDTEKIIGKRLLELFPGHEGSKFLEAYKYVAESGKPTSFEEGYSGETMSKATWFRIVVVPMHEDIAILAQDITARKIAEENLKESESKIRSYIENAPDGIFIANEKGEYLEVNQAACKITGYSEDELLKLTIPNLIQDEYLEKAINHFQTVVKEGFASSELGYKTKTGENKYWIIDAVKLSDNRFLGFAKDISRQKQTEETLIVSEEKHRALYNNAPLSYQSLDENGHFIDINPMWSKTLGYERDEVIGKWYGEFLHPDYVEHFKINFPAFKKRGYVSDVQFKLRKKDNTFIDVSFEGCIGYTPEGKFRQTYCTFKDITEQKAIENSLNKSREETLHHNERLESLLRISQFSANSIQELLDFALQEAISLTGSKIGYIFLYDEEKKQFELNTWSKEVMKECTVMNPQTVFDLDKTGCWGEAVRQRKPILVNDFQAENSLKKGTPQGHVRLEKFMTIPVFVDQKIVAVAGVANKETDYETADQRQLTLLMDSVWKISERISLVKDLEKAKEKAEESELTFRKLFEDSSDAILLIDKTGVFVECNQAALGLLKMTREAFLFQSLINISPEFQPNGRKSEVAAQEMIEITYKKGSHRFDWTCVDSEGGEFIIEISLMPIKVKGEIMLHTTWRDITKRKSQENEFKIAKEKAEQSEANIAAIIEGTHNSIWAFNNNYDILYVNETFQQEFNRSFGVILKPGLNLLASLPKTLQPLWKARYDRVLAGEQYEEEDAVPTNMGMLYIHVTFNPIVKNGQVIGGSCFGSDITSRKLSEQELIRAKEKAEESDRLKSAFLANMSHEIRTPMNGILGFSNLLKEPGLSSDKQQHFIEIIEKSGERMLNTINDIIDISKIDSNQMLVSLQVVDVYDQISELYNFFKLQCDKKGLSLKLDYFIKPDVFSIKTDKGKFNSIFTNLIRNAIKYTDEGEISIGCIKNEEHFQFYVKDTGIGIPAHRQQAIFNRFEQGDIQDKRAFQGSGLGLAISKAYAEMLGGKIWVESEAGKGSVFYFTLPYNPDNKETENVKTEEIVLSENKPIQKLNILIAEDDEPSAVFINIVVEPFSGKIFTAKTGIETVEICRNNPDIDLVLMDIQMPGMNGLEATRQVRQFNKDVIIIAQTAFALSGDNEKALEAGCNGYISKPIAKDKLLAILGDFLGR